MALGGGGAGALDWRAIDFRGDVGRVAMFLRRNITPPLAISGTGPDLQTETKKLRDNNLYTFIYSTILLNIYSRFCVF